MHAKQGELHAKLIFSHAYKSVSLLHKHFSLNVAFQN